MNRNKRDIVDILMGISLLLIAISFFILLIISAYVIITGKISCKI